MHQADVTLCYVLERMKPIATEEDAWERPPEKATGSAGASLVELLGELRQFRSPTSGQPLTQGPQKWRRRPLNSQFTKT